MTTRLNALIVICILAFTNSFAQDFEGKIIYQNAYTSKMPNVTDQQFTLMMGATQEYFIKGANYKSSSNGTFLQWQIYVSKDARIYTKLSSSLSLLYNDVTVNSDEVLKAEINKNAVKILGHMCDELVLTCKTGVQKYYYSSVAKVNPKLFENHKFGNWNEVISRSNSLPLKMSIDNPQFSIECIAMEINPMNLEDKLFELPPDSKIEKSPY